MSHNGKSVGGGGGNAQFDDIRCDYLSVCIHVYYQKKKRTWYREAVLQGQHCMKCNI